MGPFYPKLGPGASGFYFRGVSWQLRGVSEAILDKYTIFLYATTKTCIFSMHMYSLPLTNTKVPLTYNMIAVQVMFHLVKMDKKTGKKWPNIG